MTLSDRKAAQHDLEASTSDLDRQREYHTSTDTDMDDGFSPSSEQNTIEKGDAQLTNNTPNGLSKVLSRVLTRISTKTSTWSPEPPPDGGLIAWTQVACAHLVVMTSWGFINSWGVFQTYYASTLSLPPSTISWIGSVQVFLLFFVGTFTGRLTDAGYFRHVFAAGAIFQLLGIFTTSAASGSYWQLFLSQGICVGLGNGCLFCPTITTVSTYFSTKKSLAIGMTAAGSATGGLIFPSIVRQLLPVVGFAWTVRVMGFIVMASLGVSFVFLRPRIKPRKAGPVVEWAAFRELEYTFYLIGSFFCLWGVYFAFYYIASFSASIIHLPYSSSLNLLLVLNGVGLPGRLIPNFFADRVGPLNMLVPTALLGGACVLAWMAVTTVPALYVWAVFYGLLGGAIQSLFPAGLSSLTTDLRKAGVRMGMVFTTTSFATLTGPPIAGAIISATDGGGYYGAQAFAGAVMLVGMGFFLAAKVVKGRKVAAEKGGSGWLVKV
ncbi:major facilitator superfamily domain-containing protein [Bombardia bombarda]|uniref:Major facilitator superfamily domain-containing protein n=1 Tax=Bombardia bombarda TaxID=252184 RepID=A0AA39TKK1_9PEZI|nr:major facilitator superfamily domain-containing protein [Bombardia bombarda]